MMRALLLSLAVTACTPSVDPALVAEVDAWHRGRLERLTAEDGWLSLAGLHWLREGDNSIGSAPDSAVRLPPSAAQRLGVLRRDGGGVHFESAPGVRLEVEGRAFVAGPLRSDHEGAATVVAHRRLLFFVVARGDRLGVRVKDLNSAVRTGFRGIERFPVDPRWRIEARFDAYDSPRTLEIATAVGTVETHRCPGVAVFSEGGTEHRLQPVQYDGADELFFVFGDRTNRDQTYGAGRFLYTPLPAAGRVVLDFNRAFNPPCAFTPYATCPLPPKQNQLVAQIEAGEKRYALGH